MSDMIKFDSMDDARAFTLGINAIIAAAVAEERAAVVAYLRKEARAQGASPDERTILTWASNYIDRGDHRREEEP